jgi:hypothetical protein
MCHIGVIIINVDCNGKNKRRNHQGYHNNKNKKEKTDPMSVVRYQ